MPLSLIVGPPNSGRAGEILARFRAAAPRDPLLVVPNREDAERFEHELCEGGGAVLGGAVLTFGGLFGEVARATGASSAPLLGSAQRLQLVRVAVARSRLRALRPSSARTGFAPALERLLGELQAAAIDPGTLARTVAERGGDAVEAELASIYRAYAELRDTLGVADGHELAARATSGLRRDPDAWGARPVFLYGFDDLTREQLELLRALSVATEVTVAVTYEDRAALVARSTLLGELAEGLGARVEKELPANPGYTDSELLHHLERHLFEAAPPRHELGPGLELLEANGPRAEAEQIAARTARLLADGVAPEEIAIVVRHPDEAAPLFERVLEGVGVPVAAEASIPLTQTAVGRGLLALLRVACTSRAAEDLLGFLRTPGRTRPQDVDWLERAIRRERLLSAEEALGAWERLGGRALWELDAVREADSDPERLLVLARLAAEIAEGPLRRQAALARPERRLELRAAAAARAALEQLAALSRHAPGPGGAVAALEALSIPLSSGPTDGRVRVVSPYRVRAGRVRHLFVASLQDGEFPGHDPGDPLIGEERREALGLPARRLPADEERYLFHACVSRPTEGLHLSFRTTDEDGAAALPSPFLDDVRDLLAPPPPADGRDPVVEALIRRRGLDAVTFEPAEAPSVAELERAITPLDAEERRAALARLELPEPVSAAALATAEDARDRCRPLPGPLRVPEVIAALGERPLFGASTLEEYLLCSYRWFVQHELRPENLEPRPEGLTQGGIVHAALQSLYAERPGGTPTPRAETLDAWRRRARELVVELSAEQGIAADRGAASRIAVARMLALLERFLAAEAHTELPLRPDPELLEASFGDGEHDARPALDLGEFRLHGQIDRIDVSTGERRAALIRDYKLSREVPARAKLEREGRLQLQLYALAARDLWGLEPIGAVYHPLAARKENGTRPRGLLDADELEGLLAGGEFVRTDFVDASELERELERARERAVGVVRAMRAGRVRRDPRDGRCPRWCTFQPICRRERAASLEAEPDEEETA